jgi:hypothetical protein
MPRCPATYTSNIPKCIPNGEYLLRIQSLAIHNPGGTPQFYVSCAQVNVTGGGNATPGPTVKIPGAFKATDPGYTANVSLLLFFFSPLLISSFSVWFFFFSFLSFSFNSFFFLFYVVPILALLLPNTLLSFFFLSLFALRAAAIGIIAKG